MSVDYFLTDGPREVPYEFGEWQQALAVWHVLAKRALECPMDVAEYVEYEAQAVRAKRLADELEKVARRAFWRMEG